MATNANQFNPDDNNQDQGQDNFMSQPMNISGSEAQNADTGAVAGAQSNRAGSQKPTSSGSFSNLNAYLKANQGFNREGGGLAGKVNQNLTSRASDLQKN